MGLHANDGLPAVSVALVVHNGERYLATAIESVLCQTYARFEFIIIDDGSVDATPDIIRAYARADARIRAEYRHHGGQTSGLNHALRIARNDWVFLLDHDDVCLPDRFERQLRAVHWNPAVSVLGSYAFEINELGEKVGRLNVGPTTVAEFEAHRRENRLVILVHPSVLMHRPTILGLGGYAPQFEIVGDLELWSRVADENLILVLPEPLLCYRLHGDGMSMRRHRDVLRMRRWVAVRQRTRRSGQPVPTLAELYAAERLQPLGTRMRRARADGAEFLTRRAWLAWINNGRLQALFLFAGASLLDPMGLVRRLRGRLRRGH